MTREENMFLAKKLFTELVFNCAYVEGVNVTFPQTQAIIDGAIVNNVTVSDIQTILNLRDGWRYVLDNIDRPLDLEYVCNINNLVSRNESLEWGVLRSGSVGISGTEFRPDIPISEEVRLKLTTLNSYVDGVEKALDYFCYAVKAQLFWDGNKRTSTIIANKILIENNAGVLTIGKENALCFNEALLYYYDTNDKEPLTNCLKKCIKRIEYNNQTLELF